MVEMHLNRVQIKMAHQPFIKGAPAPIETTKTLTKLHDATPHQRQQLVGHMKELASSFTFNSTANAKAATMPPTKLTIEKATTATLSKLSDICKSLSSELTKITQHMDTLGLDFGKKISEFVSKTISTFDRFLETVEDITMKREAPLAKDIMLEVGKLNAFVTSGDTESQKNQLSLIDEKIRFSLEKFGLSSDTSLLLQQLDKGLTPLRNSVGAGKTLPKDLKLPESLGTVSKNISNFILGFDANLKSVKSDFVSQLIGDRHDSPMLKSLFDAACVGSHDKKEMAHQVMDVIEREVLEQLKLKNQPFPATVEGRAQLITDICKRFENLSAVLHSDTVSLMHPLSKEDQHIFENRFSASKLTPEQKQKLPLIKQAVMESKLSATSAAYHQEQSDTGLSLEQKDILKDLRQTQTLQSMAITGAYVAPGREIPSIDLPGVGKLNYATSIEISGTVGEVGQGVGLQFYLPEDDSDPNTPIFINVRGTANLGNMIDDLGSHGTTDKMLNHAPGKTDLREKFEALLLQPALKGRRIILAGHSLGGAVATSLAVRYDNQRIGDTEIHIESVKVFNGAGVGHTVVEEMKAKNFDQSKVRNFTNSGDIIPLGEAQIGTIERIQTAGNPGVTFDDGSPTFSDVVKYRGTFLAQHCTEMLTQPHGNTSGVTVIFKTPPAEDPKPPENVLNTSPMKKKALLETLKFTAKNVAFRGSHLSSNDGVSKSKILGLQQKEMDAISTQLASGNSDILGGLRKLSAFKSEIKEIIKGIHARTAQGKYEGKDRLEVRNKLLEKVSQNLERINELETDLLALANHLEDSAFRQQLGDGDIPIPN